MKVSELQRYLSRLGARFENGAGHLKIYLNGKQSVMPRHPSKEIPKGTVEAIKKQLGIK
jgi:mRNA interferase HicA